ncbi:MAG: AraC family transcriptional regulator [Sphaerochaetaceae bacterium]|nr:AraC family transcriptional regulator [Sphaerochaetaceae bacterium]MDC7249238.1 AraC family transcriptional regulator [Sphaerochaetaceae bacterium]
MRKEQIKQIIKDRINEDGLIDTSIKGVKLFRVSHTHLCSPAVYEPVVVAILSGVKEAIVDGKSYLFDSSKYLCCPISMPVEAGTPQATKEDPLLGVYISLDTKMMREITIEMESFIKGHSKESYTSSPSIAVSSWDDSFSEALFRLLSIENDPVDTAILKESRLRELYYTILKGEAGKSARRAFGVGNEIARSIEYISKRVEQPISIEDMADQVGMSRAVFHRKFKQATTMSPIQFVKSMRLNMGAMKLAAGMNINEAALQVGYVSSSQFSREFKRMYGQSPKQWSKTVTLPADIIQKNTEYIYQ